MRVENAVVLDIGFGTGTLTTKLYERGCSIYGQDFSSRMIALASEKMPNAHLYQGTFQKGLSNHCGTFVMIILLRHTLCII
ncbi:MAG: class I SAM-dependent methyltransferase [Gallintestinimicrobium sp.]